jgi:hypothetical protein
LTSEVPADAHAQARLQERHARWMGVLTFIVVLLALTVLQ